jgi:hypothetical protein
VYERYTLGYYIGTNRVIAYMYAMTWNNLIDSRMNFAYILLLGIVVLRIDAGFAGFETTTFEDPCKPCIESTTGNL